MVSHSRLDNRTRHKKGTERAIHRAECATLMQLGQDHIDREANRDIQLGSAVPREGVFRPRRVHRRGRRRGHS